MKPLARRDFLAAGAAVAAAPLAAPLVAEIAPAASAASLEDTLRALVVELGSMPPPLTIKPQWLILDVAARLPKDRTT